MLTGKLPYDGIRDEIRQKQVGNALPLAQLKGVPRGARAKECLIKAAF